VRRFPDRDRPGRRPSGRISTTAHRPCKSTENSGKAFFFSGKPVEISNLQISSFKFRPLLQKNRGIRHPSHPFHRRPPIGLNLI
jgi:hypothetical protein